MELNKDKIKAAVDACRAPFTPSTIALIQGLTVDEATALQIVLEIVGEVTAAPVAPVRGRPAGSRNRKKAETPGETK